MWLIRSRAGGRDLRRAAGYTPAASSDALDLTLGASVGVGERWLLGAALGSQQGETDIDGCGFDSAGLTGSLFAGLSYRHADNDVETRSLNLSAAESL